MYTPVYMSVPFGEWARPFWYTKPLDCKWYLNTCVFVWLQVARKLVILEGDLERSEERAEVAEA